jgi:hypothetical protein
MPAIAAAAQKTEAERRREEHIKRRMTVPKGFQRQGFQKASRAKLSKTAAAKLEEGSRAVPRKKPSQIRQAKEAKKGKEAKWKLGR